VRFSRSSIGFIVAAFAAILVLATAVVGATPILNAETGLPAADATLIHSAAYTMLAPICTLLDALTLLSLQQHAAVLGTVVLCVVVWRVLRTRSVRTSIFREVGVGLATLSGILIVYGAGAVIPRPMAAIMMHDPNDVVIDFHSHTNSSWDGRSWFTVERNRAWHAAAGFDVAYVTDHKSVAGAVAGMQRNPEHAGDGTTLLPGLEARDQYEHVVAIGIDSTFAIDPKGNWHDPVRDTTLAVTASAPLLILTIPGNIDRIPDNEKHGFARLYAVELSDAAPKGIGVIQKRRAAILRFADTLNLAVVAGSDNHGYGSTAAGWSVMQIPDWRAMNPAQLDSAIQRGIRIERRHAGRVYMRDSPDPGSSLLATVFTAPLVIWRVLADLDWSERISWLGWIVLIASIATMLSSRAALDTIPPAARRKPEKT
jgi:predicted metal-dependent phosphoesterase TrpH